MPDYPDVEIPGAHDLPWRVPRPRPAAVWCRRGKRRTGPWWVRSEPLPAPVDARSVGSLPAVVLGREATPLGLNRRGTGARAVILIG